MEASIFDKLTGLLREVFDDDTLIATPDLTAQQVDGWDSVGHVRLLLEIERTFRFRFSGTEVSSLKNVGDLAVLIAAKIRSV